MSVERKLPQSCPSCATRMKVKKLVCPHCDTEVDGLFPLPVLSALGYDDQNFIVEFVKTGGSLKDMASHLKLSYPTVRNQLDEIIDRVRALQKK
jgi:hypothetical protein